MRDATLRGIGYAAVFLVVLATMYVGSYFALVERGPNINYSPSYPPTQPSMPTYRWISAGWVQSLFAPVHALDVRLRHDYWYGD